MDWNKLGAIGSIGSFILAAGVVAKQLLAGVPLLDAGRSKLLLGLIVSGFICGAIAILLPRRGAEPVAHPGTSITDSFKQEQKLDNVGNATATSSPQAIAKYEEHHHHYPPPPPVPVQSFEPSRKQQIRHNIVFLKAEIVRLMYSGPGYSRDTDGLQSFSEVPGDIGSLRPGKMFGAVSRFRNEAIFGEDIKPIMKVRAHVKLFDGTGSEIGSGFSAAYWLGHGGDTFDLIPNDRSGSVLIFRGPTFQVDWKTRHGVRLHDETYEIGRDYPRIAEVTLLDSNNCPLLPPTVLHIEEIEGKLTVGPKLPQP